MALPIILSVTFFGAIILLTLRVRFADAEAPEEGGVTPFMFALLAALLMLFGLTLRLVIGYSAKGFTTDVESFKAWGYAMGRMKLSRLYNNEDLFLDYPPGYLYVLYLSEKLRMALDIPWESSLYTLIIKLPSILADMLCGGCLLYAGRKKLGSRGALLVSGIYLLCPVIWVNSAQWGQVDSFATAILLVSVLLLYKEQYIPSAVLYGISIAVKPQMLIFAPLYLFFVLRQKRWTMLVLGVVSAFAAILAVAAPFTDGWNFLWLLERYKSTLDYYNYYSINAYNFWTVIGWNWKLLPEGVSLTLLTYIPPILVTAACGAAMLISKRKDVLFACPVLLMSVIYLFNIKMHERYIYPVFVFMLLAFIFAPDKRLLRAFGALAAANYINVAHVLYLFNVKGGGYYPNATETRAYAVIQTAAIIYTLYVLFRVYISGELREPRPLPLRKWDRPAPVNGSFTRYDVIVMLAVTVLYGVFAFYRLGGKKAPLTSWTPDKNETAVFAADGEVIALHYMPGIAPDNEHRGAKTGTQIKVETSEDGQRWTDCGDLTKSSYVFSWAKYQLETPGRYIRLTGMDDRSVINEIGLCVSGASDFRAPTSVTGGVTAKFLFDEQDTVPDYVTYENSTYFDEIYHARTAYEHILGLEPYENTHPPLGKYIIALGILIFGMNPFGWRFMGALFGVLMLPVLYHILKQLFGKTWVCGAGTFIFAFDFMHFAQTRISTIDTYSVFFLLLMYDFMLIFIKRDVMTESMKKLLLPLLLSGIFMGLGIAAKWTAAYGAVGLAVLYFGKLYLTWRDEKLSGGPRTGEFKRRASILCLWCCLFFIAIPFGLYFAAFLPMTTLPHNIGNVWGSFINYQVNMYNYHSKLVAEHYFASPWYEWLIDYRPLWFFAGDRAEGYSTISTLGNPLIWWACLPALVCTGIMWVKRRKTYAALALCGYISVYLPWVLVPRLTFIYHYFTATPFMVMALCAVFCELSEVNIGAKRVKLPAIGSVSVASLSAVVFCAVCGVLFMVYFPVISGIPTTKAYAKALELFPSWYF